MKKLWKNRSSLAEIYSQLTGLYSEPGKKTLSKERECCWAISFPPHGTMAWTGVCLLWLISHPLDMLQKVKWICFTVKWRRKQVEIFRYTNFLHSPVYKLCLRMRNCLNILFWSLKTSKPGGFSPLTTGCYFKSFQFNRRFLDYFPLCRHWFPLCYTKARKFCGRNVFLSVKLAAEAILKTLHFDDMLTDAS